MTEQATEPAPWLDTDQAGAILGADLVDDVDAGAWAEWVEAAASYVASRRTDLVVNGAFVAPPEVRTGTAMLAYRWYLRRRSPLGVTVGATDGVAEILRYDPDLEQMLGLGRSGAFVFGGARR